MRCRQQGVRQRTDEKEGAQAAPAKSWPYSWRQLARRQGRSRPAQTAPKGCPPHRKMPQHGFVAGRESPAHRMIGSPWVPQQDTVAGAALRLPQVEQRLTQRGSQVAQHDAVAGVTLQGVDRLEAQLPHACLHVILVVLVAVRFRAAEGRGGGRRRAGCV